jgi:hypothetical protein
LKTRIKILPTIFTLAVFCTGCTTIRKSKNRSAINFIKKNETLIKDCVAFSISATLDSKTTSFTPDDITDKKVRKQIASLGAKIYVIYNGRDNYEIPDSTVTFHNTSIAMGVTEIVYDFANTPRSFPDNGSNKGDYYFVKVTDRIYYRKRAFPMM